MSEEEMKEKEKKEYLKTYYGWCGISDFDVNEEDNMKIASDDFVNLMDKLYKQVLTKREREVRIMRATNQYPYNTLEKIGMELLITRERVRQIEQKSLRRLRTSMESELGKEIFEEAKRCGMPVPSYYDPNSEVFNQPLTFHAKEPVPARYDIFDLDHDDFDFEDDEWDDDLLDYDEPPQKKGR